MHPETTKASLAQSCTAYAAQEARWIWLPFALLTKAGWQDSDGQPSGDDEQRHLACNARVNGVLDTLPDDTLLAMVDCHI